MVGKVIKPYFLFRNILQLYLSLLNSKASIFSLNIIEIY